MTRFAAARPDPRCSQPTAYRAAPAPAFDQRPSLDPRALRRSLTAAGVPEALVSSYTLAVAQFTAAGNARNHAAVERYTRRIAELSPQIEPYRARYHHAGEGSCAT
jgi:hypothetical protein